MEARLLLLCFFFPAKNFIGFHSSSILFFFFFFFWVLFTAAAPWRRLVGANGPAMGVFQLTETPTGKKKQNGKKEPKKSLKKQSKYFLKLKNKTASDVGGEGWGGGH